MRDTVQTRRSPAARQLRLALKAVPRQPAEALRVAALLQEDPLFLSYGLQLEAANSRTVARELLSGGKRAEALEAAKKSIALYQRVAENSPSPVAERKLPEELGRTEALAGEAQHGQQQAVSELLRRKHPDALTPFALRLLFPPRHLELVRKYATEHGLEPALVLSVMKQESSFRINAESGQGALGLMQLLPGTAEGLEKGAGGQLLQVEPNIRVGAKYLRYLLDYFCGNRALALASYNAGMGRVNGWKKQGLLGTDLIDFVESIPVRETRDYVAQIIRNHYWSSARRRGRWTTSGARARRRRQGAALPNPRRRPPGDSPPSSGDLHTRVEPETPSLVRTCGGNRGRCRGPRCAALPGRRVQPLLRPQPEDNGCAERFIRTL